MVERLEYRFSPTVYLRRNIRRFIDIDPYPLGNTENGSEMSKESELSDARVAFLEAFTNTGHTGPGAKQRIRDFHSAWANLNRVKSKYGLPTVPATSVQ